MTKRHVCQLLCAIVATTVVATASPVGAQPDAKKTEALKYYDQGTKKYDVGLWDDAIELYRKAYDAYPAPEFLYNIAQAYRQKQDCSQAAFFYRRYLAKKPDAPNRTQVEGFISELETNCTSATTTPENTTGTTTNGTTGTGTTTNGTTGTGTATDGTTGTGTTTNGTGTTTTSTTGTDPSTSTSNLQATTTTATATTGTTATTGGAETGITERAQPTTGKLIALSAEAGVALLEIGDLDAPAQLSLKLGAGYPLALGPVGLEVGAAATLTTLSWSREEDSGTALLSALMANVGIGYALPANLTLHGELGVGMLIFSGLADEAAPLFLAPDKVADGSLSMVNVRGALGLRYAIMPGLSASIHGAYSFSPTKDGFAADIGSIQRIEMLAGIGYAL